MDKDDIRKSENHDNFENNPKEECDYYDEEAMDDLEPAESRDLKKYHKLFEKAVLEIECLKEMFNKYILNDNLKEEAFDRLYQEMDELKRNRYFEVNRSLFFDIVLLFDRIETMKQNIETVSGDILDSIQMEIKEILGRREIEMISITDKYFNPKYQKVVATENVESEDLDGIVVKVVRDGFLYKDSIFRPQEVVVGVYR